MTVVDLSLGREGYIKFKGGEEFVCFGIDPLGNDEFSVRIESGWGYRYTKDGKLLITGAEIGAGKEEITGPKGSGSHRDIVEFIPFDHSKKEENIKRFGHLPSELTP